MLKKIKKYYPKSEFSINVLTLMTGTTIAQAILMVVNINSILINFSKIINNDK